MSGEKEKEGENAVEKLMKHFAVDLIQEQEKKKNKKQKERRRRRKRDV